MDYSNTGGIHFRREGIGLPRWLRVTGNQGGIPEREPEIRLPHPRKAAGAQLTQCRYGEGVKINSNVRLHRGLINWNEESLNLSMRNNWRASLVPATAVIPAPIAAIKCASVKNV